MNDLGETLRNLRISKKYTQAQVAKKLHKAKSTISNYENGQKLPPLHTLIELAELFNTTLDSLIGSDEKDYISLYGLTDSQIQLLHAIIGELRNPRVGRKECMSPKQLEILNSLITEFQYHR